MIGQRPVKQPKRIPAKNRRIIEARSGGVCEMCGDKPAADIHHRQYLSRGGSHDVHNLVAACGMGNTSGCHRRAHDDGAGYGWSIGRGFDSATRPLLYRGVWVLPDDEGNLERLSETAAALLMNGVSE